MHLRNGVTLYHSGEPVLSNNAELVTSLARLEEVREVRDGEGLHLTSTTARCWLDLDRDTTQNFVSEIEKKIEAQQKAIATLETRLSNKSYTTNAPKELVQQTQEQLKEAQASLEKLEQERNRFSTSS
jgi:valyl-tRNA synthetase